MKKGFALWSSAACLVLLGALVILILDQLTKLYVLRVLKMAPGESFTITPFMDILFIWNRGISYGLFGGNGYVDGNQTQRWVLVAIGLVACLVIWLWVQRRTTRIFHWGAALILGGGIGNTIDRIAYGAVADFVSLHAFGFYWYIFNIADVAIVLGFLCLLADMLFGELKSSKEFDKKGISK